MIEVYKIARFGEWRASQTGKYQVTGFQAVDDALAARISAFFSNAVNDSDAPGSDRFASFLDRAPEKRVFVGKFDDVIQSLKAITNAGAGQQTTSATDMLNGLALPVINISRQFNLSYENNAEGTEVWDHAGWRDSSGKPLADMFRQYAVLTYDITLIASERETLSLMCNAIGASMYAMSEHKLQHKGNLLGTEVELQSGINTPKALSFTDITPTSEGRIFAASTSITVTAEVMSAWELDAYQAIINVSEGLE